MSDDVAMEDPHRDVPGLLETAANRIEGLERELELANAQLEMVGFVQTLIGMRGGLVAGEVGFKDSLIASLRNRAKSIKRVTR